MACAAGRGLDLDARARPETAGCKLDPRRAFATGDRVRGRCSRGTIAQMIAVSSLQHCWQLSQCFRAVGAAEAVRMFTRVVMEPGERALWRRIIAVLM